MTDIKRDVMTIGSDKHISGQAFVLVSPTRSVIAIAQAEVARIVRNAERQAHATTGAKSLTEMLHVRKATDTMTNAINAAMTALWAEQEKADNASES